MNTVRLPPGASMEDLIAMIAWCRQNFGESKRDRMYRWTGGRWWLDGTYEFRFIHSEDAVLFSLRWS